VKRATRYRRMIFSTAFTAILPATAVVYSAIEAKTAAPASSLVAPAARQAVVAPPAMQDVIIQSPSLKHPWLPARDLTISPRALALATVTKAPQPPAEKPPLPATAATLPPPGRPQFALGPRHLIAPAPALTPRIPNLLVTPRKYAQASVGPGISPAAAISTPPVNNVDGTAALPMLPPFTRDITVEIAPPAAPLPFDRQPYLQAPGAPDDEDMPAAAAATTASTPSKPRLD
jgi:hypothetical protein